MITSQKFTGINNVLDRKEMGPGDLAVASNVDIDLAQRAQRRNGYTVTMAATKHANLFEGPGYTLATRGVAGDLVNVGTSAVLSAGMGHTPRVWYTALPGGRTGFNNGTTRGIISADGATVTPWGVPTPASAGAALEGVGSLLPGDYQWSITYVRLTGNVEGGPAYSPGKVTVASGAVVLSGLPTLANHKINVYLTGHNGDVRYYAGSTTTSLFSYTGLNKDLVRPCLTEFMQPPPTGASLIGFWRGRMLAVVGDTIFASRSHSWHLFDLQKDFKRFSGNITGLHPTDGGIWVGTTRELVFLQGDTWDTLQRVVKMEAPVVLGSCVGVPGEHLKVGDGRGDGDCMVCICDGWLVAGTADGNVVPMSVDRYRTSAAEVSATFRMAGGIPQYTASVVA